MIKVTRTSPLTGEMNTIEIHTSVRKFELWETGLVDEHIQIYFSELSPEEREFILTGITPDEWERYINVFDQE
jgi:hypothetical protein